MTSPLCYDVTPVPCTALLPPSRNQVVCDPLIIERPAPLHRPLPFTFQARTNFPKGATSFQLVLRLSNGDQYLCTTFKSIGQSKKSG